MNRDLPYDYPTIERRFGEDIGRLAGKRLRAVRLQVVSQEINVLYLGFDDDAIAIQGTIGGEVLEIVSVTSVPPPGPVRAFTFVTDFPEAAHFLGRLIVQARVVGEAWNGHGVELGFEDVLASTLLVTSVEGEENATDAHDALRVAVTRYRTEVTGPLNDA